MRLIAITILSSVQAKRKIKVSSFLRFKSRSKWTDRQILDFIRVSSEFSYNLKCTVTKVIVETEAGYINDDRWRQTDSRERMNEVQDN